MRLIDADEVLHTHYSEQQTIGKDWDVDSLATAIELAPTISLVHCKDCKHRPIDNRTKERSSNFNIEFPDGKCPCQCDNGYYSWYPEDDWFCGNGELRNE